MKIRDKEFNWIEGKHWVSKGALRFRFVYLTDLHLSTLSLQFEQTVYKYLDWTLYNADKINENLVCHILYWQYLCEELQLIIRKCKLQSKACNAIPHIPNTWGIVTKYCYYEFIILLTSCMCNILLQVSCKILSISDTKKYTQNISSDKESDCKT